MRDVPLGPKDFREKVFLRGFEGGAIYTAERKGVYYLIEDERTMADFLDEEDLAGETLTHVWAFDTEEERTVYVNERGWTPALRRVSTQPRGDPQGNGIARGVSAREAESLMRDKIQGGGPMTSANLTEYGRFSAPVPFARTFHPEAWVGKLPDSGFGVFVLIDPTRQRGAEVGTDIAEIGAVLHRGGLRACLGAYLAGTHRPGSPQWKRAERLCGETSPYLVSYLWVEKREQATKFRDKMLARYQREHKQLPPARARRVVVPRTKPTRILRVTPEIVVSHQQLVYVMLADCDIQYSKKPSRIVYIGTSHEGIRRAVRSAADRAPRIFQSRAKYFDVVTVAVPEVVDGEVQEELESALIRIFRDDFGTIGPKGARGPLCNTKVAASHQNVFRHFTEDAVRKKLEAIATFTFSPPAWG